MRIFVLFYSLFLTDKRQACEMFSSSCHSGNEKIRNLFINGIALSLLIAQK